jgi:PAS domain S-box-containing protein
MSFAQTGRDRGGDAGADRAPGLETAAPRARILVVDDDDGVRGAIEMLLRGGGFTTSTAPDGEAALAEAKRARPDVVLTDLHMPGIHGVELCRRLRELDHDLAVIVMTGSSDMQSVIESFRAGAEDYLIKPVEGDVLLWCVERTVARRAAKLEQEELHRAFNERLVLSSIREQEHAEAEAQQRSQLNALLENLSEGVAIADASGRILMINDAARAILGLGEHATIDALNSLAADDLKGRRLSSEQRPLMRALRGEHFADYEVLRTKPNGERRRVVSTGTSVRDADGNVALAIVVFRDVTELRHLEQQRDEYLALISHDLRNPLAVILMSLSMLKEPMDTSARPGSSRAPRVDVVERAERNAKRMTAMLEELTEATSLESQGVALRRVACDLREVVANIVDSMDDARAHRITIGTDDASPHVVLGDASRLERVVANLLTNALKYSAEDTPVSARLAREGGDVVLEVIDRGIGIAPESVKRLFERYYRTPGGKARASGLGLGLYIARLIVEAHSGRIDVSSEIGRGTTFRLTLPSHSAASRPPAS